MTIQGNQAPCWSQAATALLAELRGTPEGLCTADASRRLAHFGPNALGARKRTTALVAFLNQFKNPLTLILIFAAALSAFMQEWTDTAIILVLGSAALSFFQELRATTAVEKLHVRVAIKATVLRDGKSQMIPADELVPGDVVVLSVGSLIPADGVVLDARDYFVSQAVLTGEPFPVEKKPGIVALHVVC